MNLSAKVIEEILRLGGTPYDSNLDSVQWPGGVFNSSIPRIRSLFPELADANEYEIEDFAHPVRELQFVSPSVGFWPEWETMFQGTDTSRFAPFASDEAYFYFIDLNSSSNPDVYYVDHETTDEEPFHRDSYRLELFLSVLE